MKAGRTWRAIPAGLLALGFAMFPGSSAGANVTGAAADVTCPGGSSVGAKVPVLLVHGLGAASTFFTEPNQWTKQAGTQPLAAAIMNALGNSVSISEFDYNNAKTQSATDWVNNPLIGPALATRINCLAAASRRGGGPGKVIIIAHSMGGLAVRCAVDAACAGSAPANASLIGLEITLGTPNLGTFPGLVAEGTWLCDSVWGCPGLLKLANTQAGQAFDPNSALLRQLPLLPVQVPVHAFAGETTLSTSLFDAGPFSFGTTQAQDIGDIAVPVNSALAEMPACQPPDPLPVRGFSCGTTSLHAGPGAGVTIENCGNINIPKLDAWQLAASASQALHLPCWHLSEAANSQWQSDIISAVHSAAAALESAPCTAAAITSAIRATPQGHLGSGWQVYGYACDSGYALAYISVPQGLALEAVLKQQGRSWTAVYGPTEGLCLQPIDLQFCPNHQLPLPKPILEALIREAQAQVAGMPSFYVRTGYDLGTLNVYPGYPQAIGIDNHDNFAGLTWTVGTTSATGIGTLNVDNCTPDCASGTASHYPVHILLSDPQHCSVRIYDTSSNTYSQAAAYIFDKINVVSLSGNPPSYFLGNSAFSPVCG
jgi:hypothetical protein